MDILLRTSVVYLLLLVVLRLAGRRTLARISTFDFVLLLVVSETVQQAIVGEDRSLTGALIAVVTLVGLDLIFAMLKFRFPSLDQWMDGYPLILVDRGEVKIDRLKKARITMEDLLTAARARGIGRLAEIEYAILEAGGDIAIIAAQPAPAYAPPDDPL